MIIGLYKLEGIYRSKNLNKEMTLFDFFFDTCLNPRQKNIVSKLDICSEDMKDYQKSKDAIYYACKKASIDFNFMEVQCYKHITDRTKQPKYKRKPKKTKTLTGSRYNEYRAGT